MMGSHLAPIYLKQTPWNESAQYMVPLRTAIQAGFGMKHASSYHAMPSRKGTAPRQRNETMSEQRKNTIGPHISMALFNRALDA